MRLASYVPQPGQDRLRRPQLPRPRRRGRSRRCRSGRSCSPSSATPSSATATRSCDPRARTPWTSRSSSGSSSGRRPVGWPRRTRSITSAGYVVLNDVSARDWQGVRQALREGETGDGQWLRAKGSDTFLPVGPVFVGADEIPDPQTLRLRSWRIPGSGPDQGRRLPMQDGTTADMIWGVASLIEYISRAITLEPGDIIATGHAVGRRRLSRSAGLPRAGRPRPLRDRRDRLGGESGDRLVGRYERTPTARIIDVRIGAGRPNSMLALVKARPEPGLELRDVPVPEIGINDVLIRVHKTGICGTDLHIESWDPWAAGGDQAADSSSATSSSARSSTSAATSRTSGRATSSPARVTWSAAAAATAWPAGATCAPRRSGWASAATARSPSTSACR